ncbi:MAG: NADPH-dependent curcumin reductase CurA [Halioglobus sp.]|jgi:NADPH-dependent curcumin reductase CurA
MTSNTVVRFVKRPAGRPDPSIFAIETQELGEVPAGGILLKNAYLSMDPALVSRMRDEDNYTDQVNPGDVMQGYGIGQVIQSENLEVKVGEIRFGRIDMQQYTVVKNPEEFKKLNLGLARPTWYLSAVGISGATAYFSFLGLAEPKVGETVLISAGASSVGAMVAQMAKMKGCKTVAIVSTDEKAAQVKKDWGYDAAISYRGKNVDELSADIGKACPDGVDIYYDNTSGDISEAVLDHYNLNARSLVIGRLAISHLNDTRQDIGRRENNAILSKRIRKQGFVLLDHQDKMMGAFIQLAKWIKNGDVKLKEDIVEGIENVPDAFFTMLDGRSNGKQLVKLSELDEKADPSPAWLGRLMISPFFPTAWLAKRITGIG